MQEIIYNSRYILLVLESNIRMVFNFLLSKAKFGIDKKQLHPNKKGH